MADIWKSLSVGFADAVGKIAPTIGTAIGSAIAGPPGAAVGAIAMRALAGVILPAGAADKPLDQVASEVGAAIAQGLSPEQLAAVVKCEQDFKTTILDAGLKLADLDVQSQASARNREIQTGDHWTPRIIAFAILAAFIVMSWGVLVGKAKIDDALAGTIIGYMSAKAEQIVSYYFGSSLGSRLKDLAGVAREAVNDNWQRVRKLAA